MRYSPLLPMALLAGAFALGCGDPPRMMAPADPSGSSPPSFRTEHNPDGSGAIAIHGVQGAFFDLDPDPQPGLAQLIGWTFEELELFCATGEITLGSLKELFLIRPDSSVHQLVHGVHIPLLVWETASPDLCGVLLELPHLTGTGQLIITDNDVFVSGNRTNAAHIRIKGQVASEAGERFRFLAEFHGVILRNGEPHRFTHDFQLEPLAK